MPSLLELLVRLLFYFLGILLLLCSGYFWIKRKKTSTFLSAHKNWSHHPFPQKFGETDFSIV